MDNLGFGDRKGWKESRSLEIEKNWGFQTVDVVPVAVVATSAGFHRCVVAIAAGFRPCTVAIRTL